MQWLCVLSLVRYEVQRHGSGHPMAHGTPWEGCPGRGALGESIQARGSSWMHSGQSRMELRLQGAHVPTAGSCHSLSLVPAWMGPSVLRTRCTLLRDKPLSRMEKLRLRLLMMFVQCQPAGEPQCGVQTQVFGFKDSTCHHQSFTVASTRGHGAWRGRGGGWVHMEVKQGRLKSRTVALGEVQSEPWVVQRSRKILTGH